MGLREGVITAGAFLLLAAASLVLVPSDRAPVDLRKGPGSSGSGSGGASG
jgi:hypothetical protein